MSIFDDIKGLDYKEETTGDNLPRIYYFNGVDAKTVRTNGEFYTKTADAGDGWSASQRFPDEEGYSTAELWFAPLAYREQWFTTDPQTKRTVWLAHYEPGSRKYSEQIGFCRGIDEPVVLVTKGMISRAIYGKGGVMESFHTSIGAFARKSAKMAFPGWALYVPIVPPTDKKGNPVYTSTGHGSTVTIPILNPKYEPSMETINKLYVGTERLQLGAELAIQFIDWAKERRGGHDAQPLPVHMREEPAGEDPRDTWDKNRPFVNQPQPYADDEIKPF